MPAVPDLGFSIIWRDMHLVQCLNQQTAVKGVSFFPFPLTARQPQVHLTSCQMPNVSAQLQTNVSGLSSHSAVSTARVAFLVYKNAHHFSILRPQTSSAGQLCISRQTAQSCNAVGETTAVAHPSCSPALRRHVAPGVRSMESRAMNASWGTSTLPRLFMRFLPSACFFSSFFFLRARERGASRHSARPPTRR